LAIVLTLGSPGCRLERVRTLAATLQRDFFQALSAHEHRTLHALLRKLAGERV
jgi:hypothetical protein